MRTKVLCSDVNTVTGLFQVMYLSHLWVVSSDAFCSESLSFVYRQWTHVRTYGTDVFAMDMLSSISQASGDKLMKPMAFYCVFILVLRRLLPDF